MMEVSTVNFKRKCKAVVCLLYIVVCEADL